eukprot:3724686-Heterocapsa_arctica.AAC.1
MNTNMIKCMIGVPWDAKSEGPRGRPPKEQRAPPQVVPEPPPDRPEGQDQGVQSEAARAADAGVQADEGLEAGAARRAP